MVRYLDPKVFGSTLNPKPYLGKASLYRSYRLMMPFRVGPCNILKT